VVLLIEFRVIVIEKRYLLVIKKEEKIRIVKCKMANCTILKSIITMFKNYYIS